MKSRPQIRLRSIFLLIFCAAVGLAIDPSPVGAIQPAVATAMIIGLIQQARELKLKDSRDDPRFYFAICFAKFWRLAIAGLLTLGTFAQLLIARKLWELPARDDGLINLLAGPSIENVLLLSMIVVLLSNITRWQKPLSHTSSLGPTAIRFLILALLFLVVVPVVAFTHSLAHIATASIEVAQPAEYQRVGSFPDHQDEGYRLLWTSLGIMFLLLVAAWTLIASNSEWYHTSNRRVTLAVVFAISVMGVGAYCLWYYGFELSRISPDMAAAGLTSNWIDWAGAIALASIMVTAAAYRLSGMGNQARQESLYLRCNIDEPVLHESFVGVALIAALVASELYSLSQVFFPERMTTRSEIIVSILRAPQNYLMLTVILLGLRTCWLAWYRKHDNETWQLLPLDPRRFAENCVALTALTTVGVPALSSYAFVFWLGPWYRIGS